MPTNLKIWSAEQLKQMNEEKFLVEMLDMFKYTPELGESDADVQKMRAALDRVEEALRTRLEVKQEE